MPAHHDTLPQPLALAHTAQPPNPHDDDPSALDHHITHARIGWGVVAWLSGVLTLIALGVMDHPPRPLIPAAIFGTTLAGLIGFARSPRLMAWLRALDVRWLVGYHLIRAAFGAAFLVELSRGTIHPLFAERAGPGDLLAAALAVLALIAVSAGARWRRGALWAFSALGLADMLLVIMTAQWVVFTEGVEGMGAMFSRVPYALLPWVVVPLVLLTHAGVIWKLWRRAGT